MTRIIQDQGIETSNYQKHITHYICAYGVIVYMKQTNTLPFDVIKLNTFTTSKSLAFICKLKKKTILIT